MTTQSQLPMGGGLGSSAAFNTSLCLAMLRYLKPSEFTEASIPTALIQKYSFECEKFMHGNPSGIDNGVSTFGGVIGFKSGNIEAISNIPPIEVLVTDTKISRNTRILVEGVGVRAKQFPDVVQPILDSIDNISIRSLNLFRSGVVGTQLEEELKTLIVINHHLLGALGVGHEALDRIYHTTKNHNLHSKLTGAGGGGCAFTLFENSTTPELKQQIIEELAKQGFASFLVQVGCVGAQLHETLPELEWK